MRWERILIPSHFGIILTILLLAVPYPGALARLGPSEVRSPGYERAPDRLFAVFPPNLFVHNVGLLTLRITNIGLIGNPYINDISAGWRGGEYLFDSGLWIGAIGADSSPHVSSSRFQNEEFLPELGSAWTIYESFEGAKGGIRVGSQDASGGDDDRDGLIDEDFNNGLDDDGDGRIDEDFAAVGQQMFSCMYRDDTPESITGNPDHFPLNLLVRQRSFAWSTTGTNEFVGLDFEIVNRGDQRLKDLYVGFFSDTDAGPKQVDRYWTDDLVGWAHIDTTLFDAGQGADCSELHVEIDTAFMWDAPDDGTQITGGDVPGVFGSLFLGHTTDDTGVRAPAQVGLTTVAWFSSEGDNTDPKDDEERYALLGRGQKPRRNAVKPEDYRYVISAGPFAELSPGQSLKFQSAYVIGDGQPGFRANAVNAQRVFNGRYVDGDKNALTGVDGKEYCLQILEAGTQIFWDDPCDTLVETEAFRSTPSCDIPGPHYVDNDCDPCTGIDGKETLVNWVGVIAPPSPGLNTGPPPPQIAAFASPAGDRRVILQWDNLSQLFPDPISGVNLFEGYRVWRVDNWERPEGSFGPSQEEWMKVAEFRLHPEDANQTGVRDLMRPPPDGAVIRGVREIGFTDDNPPQPIYPVGRYQYEDTLGIINGKLYFYAVTAFGFLEVENPLTKQVEQVEIAGFPNAVEAEAVVPRWDSMDGCRSVTVVPNPYRGGADWDLIPSERDPTGSKIAFRNLPKARCTIRIYTLAGDLVREAEHNGTGGDGTYFWNLITRNGQNVVSGIYLYSVEYSGGVCRGRFVIMR